MLLVLRLRYLAQLPRPLAKCRLPRSPRPQLWHRRRLSRRHLQHPRRQHLRHPLRRPRPPRHLHLSRCRVRCLQCLAVLPPTFLQQRLSRGLLGRRQWSTPRRLTTHILRRICRTRRLAPCRPLLRSLTAGRLRLSPLTRYLRRMYRRRRPLHRLVYVGLRRREPRLPLRRQRILLGLQHALCQVPPLLQCRLTARQSRSRGMYLPVTLRQRLRHHRHPRVALRNITTRRRRRLQPPHSSALTRWCRHRPRLRRLRDQPTTPQRGWRRSVGFPRALCQRAARLP